MSNPFDFLNSINSTKENLIRNGEAEESEYKPFLTNRALSYHVDSIFEANDMNERAHLPNICQYEYLLNSLPKKKRFAKWIKPSKDVDAEAVMEYFGYSLSKAAAALKILSKEDIAMIHDKLDNGGVKNDKRRPNKRSGGD